MRDRDRFRGCLIGGAAGDALGYAVEFLNERQIFSSYGESGISEYRLHNKVALISDDTQMTLFTANGLLVGATKELMQSDIRPYQDHIRLMYKAWFRTQTGRFMCKDGNRDSWLLNIPELFSPRAPGNTCLDAIRSGALGSVINKINNSKGCGGVMRVAPIGLYFCDKDISLEDTDILGAEAAAITHTHELGYIPAAALVHIIRRISEDGISLKDAVYESIDAMVSLFKGCEHIDEFESIMRIAVDLSSSDVPDLEAIHELGEGWVAEETLAIAVYCALKYSSDFDKAIRVSVNHKGDSDSTGAVTGNILGAYLGYDKIPQKYKDDLELSDLILEIADDLYNDCRLDMSDEEKKIWNDKYLTASYCG